MPDGVQQYDRGRMEVATHDAQSQYAREARDLAAEMLVEDSENITSTAEVHARPILPSIDLNAGGDQDTGATGGWNGTDPQWTQNAASGSATAIGDELEYYTFDKDDRMDGKTAVLYGVRDLVPGTDITDTYTQIVIRDSSGGKVEQYDISELDTAEGTDYALLFDNPIALRENKTINVSFVASTSSGGATAIGETHLMLAGSVAEQAGNELVESNKFVTAQRSGTDMATYDRGARAVATDAAINGYEQAARGLAASMLVDGLASVSTTADVHVRHLLPSVDLNSGSDNAAWNGSDPVWEQTTGGSIGDVDEVYQFDPDNRMDNKTAVVYGIRDLSGGSISDDVLQIIARDSSGAKVEQYDLSQLDVAEESDYTLLFENPIALQVDKSLDLEFVAGGSGSAASVQLLGTVAEQSGNQLQESGRFYTNQA